VLVIDCPQEMEEPMLYDNKHKGEKIIMNRYKNNAYAQTLVNTNTQNGLYIYLNNIKRYHLLTREKERELAFRVKRFNDKVAEAELIESNLRLVVKIAIDFNKKFTFHLQDLIQEGNVGLTKAARKFDPDRNVKFSIYASYWIKAHILKFLMENWSIVKIGTTKKQRVLFFNLNKVKKQLFESSEQDSDIAEYDLFKSKGINHSDINEMDQCLNKGDDSLNALLMQDSKVEKLDALPSNDDGVDEQFAEKEIQKNLQAAIAAFRKELNARELDILNHRMISDAPQSLRQLGEKYGISRERIRQIEKRIFNRFKEFVVNNYHDRLS
jgi:RNA polymerase sigma-32 factor